VVLGPQPVGFQPQTSAGDRSRRPSGPGVPKGPKSLVFNGGMRDDRVVVETDRNDMVVLGREQCMNRLGRGGVGRVALAVGGEPAIFPVNYAVKDDDVYFLTAPGSKLAAAAEGATLAFEVDHIDAFEHGGWSVVIAGPSCIVPLAEAEPLWKLKLGRWVGGGPEVQVRIRAERVSGREISKPGRGSGDLSVTQAETSPSPILDFRRRIQSPS
jgi:hypothetical protein